MHCEDLDWCMRFREAGWRIVFVPSAHAVHRKGQSSRHHPIRVELHKHIGMIKFYRKFFRHQYPALLMWMVSAAVWMRFAVKAGVVAATSAGRALRGGTSITDMPAQAGREASKRYSP